MRSLLVIALPLTFVTVTLTASEMSHGRDFLERVFFLAGMSVAAYALFRLLTPGGVFRDYFAARQTAWSERFKHVWSIAGVSIPFALAGLAAAGFYYTAEVLSWRLFVTFGLLITLIVGRSLFFRMLMLRRRYLSMEQSRQRAAASAASSDLPSQMQLAATFEGFGESSLNMVLRTYLATLDNRLDVIHELHTSIDKAFRAEGIEIAFPQRDLHVRTGAGLIALGTAPSENATSSFNDAIDQRLPSDLSKEAA